MQPVRQLFETAERLAPQPATREASTRAAWIKHYAAMAMAAHAAFRDAMGSITEDTPPGSRPDLGYLITIATTAAAATVALMKTHRRTAEMLWDLTPEAGALNGEYIDFLAGVLAGNGINPADLYPWYDARDFEPIR